VRRHQHGHHLRVSEPHRESARVPHREPARETALLVVDLQQDYFTSDELSRCRDDLVRTVGELVRRARESGVVVVEARTEHAADGSTWALNMRDDDQGMVIAGTPGAERLPGLPDPDVVVVKHRDSAFHDTELDLLLHERGITRLVLAGVSTESCISATAVDAYAHDLRVTLVEDATASVDPALHHRTLQLLRDLYRTDVRRADDVVLGQDPPKG